MGNVKSQAVMRRLGLIEHSHYRHPTLPADHELADDVAFCTPPDFQPA